MRRSIAPARVSFSRLPGARFTGRLLLLALLAGALPGCSFFQARSQVRGNPVDPDVLKELVPGTSSEADARALLGSPTLHAAFDDNTWLYISQITRPRVGRIQGVEQQHVVTLHFAQNGVLKSIDQATKKNALPAAMASGSTPSPGSNPSILQQLLGNVGRYSPIGGNTGNGLGGSLGNTGAP